MRLVIREYLSMLRESEELDALLPDLLSVMGIEPVSKPQVGVRQLGVDVAGVGPDPEDGTEKLFLLTVKQGNIDRSDWDGSPQAVRPSLDEILEIYLPHNVDDEHRDLPKKIVLCCGGDMKQAVEPNWRGYKSRHSEPGLREYDFWGGDKLAALIERHFLDEYLFPESAQKKLRKTIALADQNEDEPRHFYAFVYETLFERGLPTESTPSAKRQRQRALRLLNLSLNIVFHWCREADNLHPALLCAERAVLLTWDWMREIELLGCETTRGEFERIFVTYLVVTSSYAGKLVPLCAVPDGLSGQWADELEYPLRTYESVGILAVLAAAMNHIAASSEGADRESADQRSQNIAELLAALIANNSPAATPRFDEHGIDIALGLLALHVAGLRTFAAGWVEDICARVPLAYNLGEYFPIHTDSYDDLVALHVRQGPPKESLMRLSTLLPMLAHWHAVFNMNTAYERFQEAVAETFDKTTLQLWFPYGDTEEHLYRDNAGFTSGTTLAPVRLPATLDGLKEYVTRLRKERREFEKLSCFEQGWPILGLIASRHYRTPVIPAYWHQLIDPSLADQEAASNVPHDVDGSRAEDYDNVEDSDEAEEDGRDVIEDDLDEGNGDDLDTGDEEDD